MTRLVVANLQMNMVVGDLNRYLKGLSEIKDSNVVIFPSTIFIPYFIQQGYSVGIQDISTESKGSFTGEVSALQANSMGVKYAFIGHVDRRNYLSEPDTIINKKIGQALQNNITPVLCIGESYEEKAMMKTEQIIKRQILNALRNIRDIEKVIIAYIPAWEIDNNSMLSTNDIEEIVDFIKNIVKLNYKCDTIKVMYGGGINTKNIKQISKISNIDGFIIDNAALDVNNFKEIIEVVE